MSGHRLYLLDRRSDDDRWRKVTSELADALDLAQRLEVPDILILRLAAIQGMASGCALNDTERATLEAQIREGFAA